MGLQVDPGSAPDEESPRRSTRPDLKKQTSEEALLLAAVTLGVVSEERGFHDFGEGRGEKGEGVEKLIYAHLRLSRGRPPEGYLNHV